MFNHFVAVKATGASEREEGEISSDDEKDDYSDDESHMNHNICLINILAPGSSQLMEVDLKNDASKVLSTKEFHAEHSLNHDYHLVDLIEKRLQPIFEIQEGLGEKVSDQKKELAFVKKMMSLSEQHKNDTQKGNTMENWIPTSEKQTYLSGCIYPLPEALRTLEAGIAARPEEKNKGGEERKGELKEEPTEPKDFHKKDSQDK